MEGSEADEYLDMLMKKETSFQSVIENRTDWFISARLDAIESILERASHFEFHCTTAYLSLIYFDRFLSEKDTSHRAPFGVRFVAMACLSLAAKMEEVKAVPLSGYYEVEYNLEFSNMIHKLELLILRNLDWKMICVTPFVYLRYFVTKFFEKNVHGHQQMVSKATELILAVMGDAAQQRPSIVAAAAVLAAHDHPLTKTGLEIKMDAVPSWGSLEKEQMFICYKLMRDVVLSRSTPPN